MDAAWCDAVGRERERGREGGREGGRERERRGDLGRIAGDIYPHGRGFSASQR